MVKHTQTIRWLLPTNCLILFDHFVGLALKGLSNVFLKVHKITLIMVLWFIILVNSVCCCCCFRNDRGKVFKNEPSKIYGRQPLKNLKRMVCFCKGCLPQILLGPFLNTWSQIYYVK